MERDLRGIGQWRNSGISTHALTWSATGSEMLAAMLMKNFNSRAHVERDSNIRTGRICHARHFNSRAHVERDALFLGRSVNAYTISTHALTWSATLQKTQQPERKINFNSRAHVERDMQRQNQNRYDYAFQLTRSRGARHTTHCRLRSCSRISTHALTWSATYGAYTQASRGQKFQLTRSRGARHCHRRSYRVKRRNFNSRAHVERDAARSDDCGRGIYFNSRAHVERDLPQCRQHCCAEHFNSRAHVERDIQPIAVCVRVPEFQLTRSRGARHTAHIRRLREDRNFNSRAHVERDKFAKRYRPARKHFNSRAHVERDLRGIGQWRNSGISTHALTWSATSQQTKPP